MLDEPILYNLLEDADVSLVVTGSDKVWPILQWECNMYVLYSIQTKTYFIVWTMFILVYSLRGSLG